MLDHIELFVPMGVKEITCIEKIFSLTTTEIWNELISSDMKNGSLLRKSSLLTNDATFKPDHQNNKAKALRGYFECTHFDHIH